jgi:RNA polymerase sigma-70 factor (ECF subfamily)
MNAHQTMTQTQSISPTEEQLVRAAQQGCTDSFRCLIDRFGGKLVRFLQRRTGCAQDAEDIAQETFIRVYLKLGSYRHIGQFSTWIYTIASRLAVSHHRRQRPTGPIPDAAAVMDTAAGPTAQLETAERDRHIRRLARTLPANQWQAMELRYLEQKTIEDIAQVMGKTQMNVKVLLHRARQNLAAKLRAEQIQLDSADSQSPRPTAEAGKSR